MLDTMYNSKKLLYSSPAFNIAKYLLVKHNLLSLDFSIKLIDYYDDSASHDNSHDLRRHYRSQYSIFLLLFEDA